MAPADLMARFNEPDLYVVITESFGAGRPPLDILDAILQAGVRLIQFREKDLDDGEMYRRAEAFRKRTEQAGALLIVDGDELVNVPAITGLSRTIPTRIRPPVAEASHPMGF